MFCLPSFLPSSLFGLVARRPHKTCNAQSDLRPLATVPLLGNPVWFNA